MPELSGAAPLVLGMVKKGRQTGYEIKRLVDVSVRFFWAGSPGQIYPELSRLESAGLLSCAKSPRGGRARNVYSLTEAGERALHAWLTDPSESAFELRNEGLLKVFFADCLSDEEAIAVVRAMRAQHEAILDGIRRATPAYGPGRRFGYITWQYGLGLHGWIVEWCKQTERDLAEGRPPGGAPPPGELEVGRVRELEVEQERRAGDAR
ncbi:MAG: PadR family transcriptional regulator [Thermoleophilaceae bacterium]|jgi:DNA-binding PadR family transcriptional regulator|nr:PadR family transcriptional regulator [Thermoleophilaceae bacterium]